MTTTGTDYGRGTTRSDNSPGTAGSLSFTTTSVAESGSDLEAVQPLPLGPVYAEAESDLTPVQPLPLEPVQPIMPETGADQELQPVQPLPLGPVYAETTGDVTPVQPLPLGPVYAETNGDVTPVQPLPLGPVYADGSDVVLDLIGSDTINVQTGFTPAQEEDWMTGEGLEGMAPGQEGSSEDHGAVYEMAELVIDFALPRSDHPELLAG